MLEKFVHALHCYRVLAVIFCVVFPLFLHMITQYDVAASAFCSPERGLAASDPCRFSADGFLLSLPSIARNFTNTARILLKPILIILHIIGAI